MLADYLTMMLFRFALPALIAGLTSLATGADEKPPAQRYHTCLSEVENSPKDAFEDAIQWAREGGGGPAEHCAASALMAMGLYADAAKRLEALAQSVKKGPQFKARILAQAGQAWLLANDVIRAEAVATTALHLMPKAPALLIDRARARAEQGDYAGAKADLDIALMGAPGHPDALAFRAAASRFLDETVAARADTDAALARDPNHPEALLERGILKRLTGDKDGARADWIKLLEVAPGTGAADAARANLEKMDVKK